MKHWTEIFEEKLTGWWMSFIRSLPNVLVALLVMVLFIMLSRLVKGALQKTLNRFAVKSSVSSLSVTIVQIVILFVGLFIMLDILHLNKAVSSLLAGAGIIGIILGFAFQDITSNFISGIYIAIKKPFEAGDTVKTNDFIGNVERIQLRTTTIRTFDGLHLMIPNKEIIQKPMINYSLTPTRRIELEFYIDHRSDLDTTHRAAFNAITKLSYLYPGKPVEVFFNDFKYSAIKLSVWFWINNHEPPGYMVARHDAIYNIVSAMKEKKIPLVIPIPTENSNLLN
jgi:small conductance mechanosensitive channel